MGSPPLCLVLRLSFYFCLLLREGRLFQRLWFLRQAEASRPVQRAQNKGEFSLDSRLELVLGGPFQAELMAAPGHTSFPLQPPAEWKIGSGEPDWKQASLGLGHWLGSPHPNVHPRAISGDLSCPAGPPSMLEPGEFQGHQLMGPDLPGTSQPGNHPEFMEYSINQAAGMILGLTEATLFICFGLWVEMGPRKKRPSSL